MKVNTDLTQLLENSREYLSFLKEHKPDFQAFDQSFTESSIQNFQSLLDTFQLEIEGLQTSSNSKSKNLSQILFLQKIFKELQYFTKNALGHSFKDYKKFNFDREALAWEDSKHMKAFVENIQEQIEAYQNELCKAGCPKTWIDSSLEQLDKALKLIPITAESNIPLSSIQKNAQLIQRMRDRIRDAAALIFHSNPTKLIDFKEDNQFDMGNQAGVDTLVFPKGKAVALRSDVFPQSTLKLVNKSATVLQFYVSNSPFGSNPTNILTLEGFSEWKGSAQEISGGTYGMLLVYNPTDKPAFYEAAFQS